MRSARAPQAAARLVLAGGLVVGSWAAEAGSTPAPAPLDSTRLQLPFEPLQGPDDWFAVSPLSRAYAKDLTRLLRPAASRSWAELETLDRYAEGPPPGFVPAELDSSDIRLVGARPEGSTAELTPEDKKEAKPAQAGVQVGIPSSVAASATIIGGIAMFIKVLTELIK